MYVDLVGSTNMSMTLPVDKLVTIIRAFSYEVTSVIQSHGGYVLKYVGDAVIAFFPSSSNRIAACTNSVECGRAILMVIKNGINPIFNQYDYPELSAKIGNDE
jgi:adenylate cyclase